jgi:hypothetical protein
VRLSLEQLPARGEDLEQLASLLSREERRVSRPDPAPAPAALPELMGTTRLRLRHLAESVDPPAGVVIVGLDLVVTGSGGGWIVASYAAPGPLQSQAEEMLRRQLTRDPELQGLAARLDHVSTATVPITGTPADSVILGEVAARLAPGLRLAVEILVPASVGPEDALAVARVLRDHGVDPTRIYQRDSAEPGLAVRIVPDPTEPGGERPDPAP